MDIKGKFIKGKLIFIFILLSLLVLPGLVSAQVHTVSKGETINKISDWYNVSPLAIRYANNLWTDTIYPGQRLGIPFKYTVKKGDTPYLIGKTFGVDHNKVIKANNLKNNYIYPGQVLYIPARQAGNMVSRGGISASEFDVLARIITAESDSESFATQVAVGAVVLNRVKSNLFPNTIREVVYQIDAGGKYQFEPVLNGWINNPATASGNRAAMEALKGKDPSNGALFFFESWVTNKFLNARPVSTIMDAFTFTY
ncbi:MAG: LysM peptidoglycan-binding domain-containing protein [Firmicutes bacterium]|nr:LysM peptidoglycan-binding domain-containing protein [Bacillota bacterium]